MNDLNFFEVAKVQDEGASFQKISIAGGIILGALILSTLAYNTISTLKLNRTIDELNAVINNADVKAQYEESISVKEQKDVLNKYYSKLDGIFDSISERDKVSPKFMADITSTIPKEVSFKTINFSDGVIEISAESTSRDAIAEFQYNMNQLAFIKNSHIGAITSNLNDTDENFNFSISCNLKEEYYNENQ